MTLLSIRGKVSARGKEGLPAAESHKSETHAAHHLDGAAGGLVGSLSGDFPDHRRQLPAQVQWLSHYSLGISAGARRRLLVWRPFRHSGFHAQAGRALHSVLHDHLGHYRHAAGLALYESSSTARGQIAARSVEPVAFYRSGTGGDKGSSGVGFACSLVRAPGKGVGASRTTGAGRSYSSLFLRGLGGAAARRASTSA